MVLKFLFLSPLKGPCHVELQTALEKISKSQQKLGDKLTRFYLPNCEKQGRYKAKQVYIWTYFLPQLCVCVCMYLCGYASVFGSVCVCFCVFGSVLASSCVLAKEQECSSVLCRLSYRAFVQLNLSLQLETRAHTYVRTHTHRHSDTHIHTQLVSSFSALV